MEGERITTPIVGAAALEHLTGPSHGKVMWLSASAIDISMTPRRFIHVADSRPGEPSEDLIARLHSAGETYEIEVPEDRAVWVNGVRIQSKLLEKGDMIEFGEAGPLSRFCLYGEDTPIRQSIADILNDSITYLRVSRQPKTRRVYRAVRELLRRLSLETTTLFRITVVVAIVGKSVV